MVDGTSISPDITPNPAPVIDFDSPPQNMTETYKFGEEPITRDNFSAFLIDNFSRSRGSVARQAWLGAWSDRHVGTDTVGIMKGFISRGGFLRLTKKEQDFMMREFGKVKEGHRFMKTIDVSEPADAFAFFLYLQLKDVISVREGEGRFLALSLDPSQQVLPMNEDVLNMDKSSFLHWLATTDKKATILKDIDE